MVQFSELQSYLDAARRTTEAEDLRSATEAFVKLLGFDYFALLHHVNFEDPPADAIRLGNYPPWWREMVAERRYFSDDPILSACQHMITGFRWRDVGSVIPLTRRQREIRNASVGAGLGDGFTVPIHMPGEVDASCSFGVLGTRPLPVDSFPTAHYVTRSVVKTAAGYSATGALTLHGVTKDVPIEFKFAPAAAGASLSGTAQLKRTDFGVGQGDWKNTDWVADAVKVAFSLALKPKPP